MRGLSFIQRPGCQSRAYMYILFRSFVPVYVEEFPSRSNVEDSGCLLSACIRRLQVGKLRLEESDLPLERRVLCLESADDAGHAGHLLPRGQLPLGRPLAAPEGPDGSPAPPLQLGVALRRPLVRRLPPLRPPLRPARQEDLLRPPGSRSRRRGVFAGAAADRKAREPEGVGAARTPLSGRPRAARGRRRVPGLAAEGGTGVGPGQPVAAAGGKSVAQDSLSSCGRRRRPVLRPREALVQQVKVEGAENILLGGGRRRRRRRSLRRPSQRHPGGDGTEDRPRDGRSLQARSSD